MVAPDNQYRCNYRNRNNNKHTLNPVVSLACSLALLTGSLLLGAMAHADTYYRWVDKDGSTKYTLTPPPKRLGKAIKKVSVESSTMGSGTNGLPGSNTNPNSASNNSSSSDAQQTASANAALNNQNTQNNTQPNPNSATLNNTAPPASLASTPAISSISPPPPNRLIVPAQSQTRPAFDNR